MKKLVLALSAIAMLGATASFTYAEDTPQHIREELMESVGKQAKVLGPMLQGKAPFDAAAAKAALEIMAKDAADFPNHFPDGSYEGKTEALPIIAENKDDFNAKAKKFADDAAAAVLAVDGGEEAFKAAAGAVFANCKGCHEKYRKPS